MDVARLNFSHGDPDTHRRAAADVRAAAQAVGRPVAIIGDLQGPKIRTGALDSSFLRLVRGRQVVLTASHRQDPNEIEVSHGELIESLRKGDRVLLDDGRIELTVRSIAGGRAACSVVRGGLLGERKGVSVPGRTPPLPALTDKDIIDLKLAVELGVDYVALSFVRRPDDVLMCQQHLAGLNCTAPVIAKLEKVEAIRELNDILDVAGAVMVARGDLGVELRLGELPAVQQGPAACAGHRRQPERGGAAPDLAVRRGGAAAGGPGPRHRRDVCERHRSGCSRRLRAGRRPGRDRGGSSGRQARPDEPAESGDRLRSSAPNGRLCCGSVYSFRVLSRAAATQPPGPQATAPGGAGERYGPNTAEVTVFIESVGRLSPSRWRKVIAAREAATRVTRDRSSQPAEIVRAMLAGAPDGTGTLPEPMSNVAADVAAILAKRSDAEAVAAWQAAAALE